MPGVHATLSASKAKQWLTCPPSARLNERLTGIFGEHQSEFAAEGTKAHSLAELKLRKETEEINDFNYQAQRKLLGSIPPDMEKATDIYVDLVMEKYFAAKRSCSDAKLMLEQRLDFSRWVPSGFGTGDAVIVSDELLEVLDYKHGAGVPVSAVGNPQARLYGLGAISAFSDIYGFENVRNTIVQPRIDNITEETLTKDELLSWADEIQPIAELAWRGEGEFKTGDHCRFCNARAICAARASEAMSLFKTGFQSPDVIPDEDIPGILAVADTAEAWIKDIRAYALNQAAQGKEWRGFKLVRGRRPARAWRNEEAVKEQLIRAGYPEETYISTKLKGVSEIEKSIGRPAFVALLGAEVSQGEGNLTLVPADDKRVQVTPTETAFGDLINNTI